jgi:hypothetical protein
MSAAAHADLLFVKEMANGDSDLATYCKYHNLLGRLGRKRETSMLMQHQTCCYDRTRLLG